jgi:hypothetical protein
VKVDYGWMKLYKAAVLETHSEVLPERIEAAQKAKVTCDDCRDLTRPKDG